MTSPPQFPPHVSTTEPYRLPDDPQVTAASQSDGGTKEPSSPASSSSPPPLVMLEGPMPSLVMLPRKSKTPVPPPVEEASDSDASSSSKEYLTPPPPSPTESEKLLAQSVAGNSAPLISKGSHEIQNGAGSQPVPSVPAVVISDTTPLTTNGHQPQYGSVPPTQQKKPIMHKRWSCICCGDD